MEDDTLEYLLQVDFDEVNRMWDELPALTWEDIPDWFIVEYNNAVARHNLSDYFLNKDIKRLLKIMSDYISKSACRIQLQLNTIYRSVLILFGMCATRPAYIYAAIFGSSSTRIFS